MIAIQEALKQLRTSAGLSQAELGELISVSRDTIARVESGTQKVTVDFLDQVAEVLGTSITTIIHMADDLRKNSTPQADLSFEYLCRDHQGSQLTPLIRNKFESWYTQLEDQKMTEPGIPLLEIPVEKLGDIGIFTAEKTRDQSSGKSKNIQDINKMIDTESRKLAEILRSHWNMGSSPISDPVALIRSLGFFITGLDFGNDGLLGVSGRRGQHGVYAMMINTNASQPVERQRFSIIHELAHVAVHGEQFKKDPQHTGRGRGKDNLEKFADAFSAHFQVPDSELQRALNILTSKQIKGESLLFTLKLYFRVSYQTMLYRLKDVGYLNQKTFGPWFGRLKRKYHNAEPAPITEPLNLPVFEA